MMTRALIRMDRKLNCCLLCYYTTNMPNYLDCICLIRNILRNFALEFRIFILREAT